MFNKCVKLIKVKEDIIPNKYKKICVVLNKEVNTTIFGNCISHENNYCYCFKKEIIDIK